MSSRPYSDAPVSDRGRAQQPRYGRHSQEQARRRRERSTGPARQDLSTEDNWDPRYAQPPPAPPTVYRPSEHRRYTSQPKDYYSSRRAAAISSYSSRYYKNRRRDEELRGRSPSLPPPSRRAHREPKHRDEELRGRSPSLPPPSRRAHRELKHRRRSSSLSPPSRRAHREPEPAHDDDYSDSFDSNSLLVDQRMADELELTDDQSMDTRDDFDLHERHDNTGRRSTTFENKTEALKIWGDDMSERHGIEGVFILGSRKRTEEHLTAVIETPGAQGMLQRQLKLSKDSVIDGLKCQLYQYEHDKRFMTERMTERDIELPGGRFDDSHSRTNSKKPQESSSDAPAKIKAKRSSQNQQSSSPAGIKGKKLKKKVRSKSKSQEHAKNPKQSTKEQRPSSRSRLNAGTKVKLEGESYGNKDGERDEGGDDQQEERMQGEDDGGGDSDDDDEYEVAISDTTTGRPTTRGSSAAAGKPASSDKSPKKSCKSTGKGKGITIPTVDDSDQNLARIMKLPSKAKKSQMAQIFKPVFSEFVCKTNPEYVGSAEKLRKRLVWGGLVDDYAASGTHMYGWPADTRYPQESSRGADVLAAQDMLPLIVAIRDGVLVAIEALPEDKNRLLDGRCPVIVDGSNPFMSAFTEGKRGQIRQENADTIFIAGLQKRLIAKGYSHIQPADIVNLQATSGSGSKRGREDDDTDEDDESNSNNEAKVGADKIDKQSKHRNKKRRGDVAAEEDAEVSADATKEHRKKKKKTAEVDADENDAGQQVTPGYGGKNRRIHRRTESAGRADVSREIDNEASKTDDQAERASDSEAVDDDPEKKKPMVVEDEPSSQNANKKSGEAIIDNAQMASDSDSVKQPRSSPLADLDEPEKLDKEHPAEIVQAHRSEDSRADDGNEPGKHNQIVVSTEGGKSDSEKKALEPGANGSNGEQQVTTDGSGSKNIPPVDQQVTATQRLIQINTEDSENENRLQASGTANDAGPEI